MGRNTQAAAKVAIKFLICNTLVRLIRTICLPEGQDGSEVPESVKGDGRGEKN